MTTKILREMVGDNEHCALRSITIDSGLSAFGARLVLQCRNMRRHGGPKESYWTLYVNMRQTRVLEITRSNAADLLEAAGY